MLAELIERLERAEEGSRELDAAIWETLDLVDEAHCQMWCNMDGRTDLTREMFVLAWAPHYTTSLDAALRLVPEGWDWSCQKRKVGFGVGHAAVFDNLEFIRSNALLQCDAQTPTLALCIAALKARAEVLAVLSPDEAGREDGDG